MTCQEKILKIYEVDIGDYINDEKELSKINNADIVIFEADHLDEDFFYRTIKGIKGDPLAIAYDNLVGWNAEYNISGLRDGDGVYIKKTDQLLIADEPRLLPSTLFSESDVHWNNAKVFSSPQNIGNAFVREVGVEVNGEKKKIIYEVRELSIGEEIINIEALDGKPVYPGTLLHEQLEELIEKIENGDEHGQKRA